MTTVHVVPIGDEPEQHTLGECHCRPRRRRIRIGGILDWVHFHRSLAAPDDWDIPAVPDPGGGLTFLWLCLACCIAVCCGLLCALAVEVAVAVATCAVCALWRLVRRIRRPY